MHSRYNLSVQISRSFSLRSILYYTLIALHRCDSSQHILPRPRKCTWDITFSSAVSPFMSGSFPSCRRSLLMNPAPLSSKFFIHIVLFITYVKKSQSFFLYFYRYFFIIFIITVYYTFSTRHGTDLISTNPVIGSA